MPILIAWHPALSRLYVCRKLETKKEKTMNTNIGVKIEVEDGVSIFSIEGHLDATLVNALNERIYDIIESSFTKVIFDFSHLVYISSAGLRVLLYAAKKMKAKDGKVVLCSVNNNVRRVLDISGLTKFLPIYDDKKLALDALKA